jgi:hypothetical protein
MTTAGAGDPGAPRIDALAACRARAGSRFTLPAERALEECVRLGELPGDGPLRSRLRPLGEPSIVGPQLVGGAIAHALRGDWPGLLDIVARVSQDRSELAVWQELLHPALAEASRRLVAGELTRSDVRLVELLVGALASARGVQPAADAPASLLFCPPTRDHLLTLHVVAPVVALAGWQPFCVLEPVEADDVVDLARRLGARLLGISAESRADLAAVDQLVPVLGEALPGVAIAIGRGMPYPRPDWRPPPPAVVLRSSAEVYAHAREARALLDARPSSRAE